MTVEQKAEMAKKCPLNAGGRVRAELKRVCHRFNISDAEHWLNVRTKSDNELVTAVRERPMMGYVIAELVEMFMFDFIVGNLDRSLRYNVFVFDGATTLASSSRPPKARIAFLDQGYAFCTSGCSPFWEDNPFFRKWRRSYSNVCRFSTRSVAVIKKLHTSGPPSRRTRLRSSREHEKADPIEPGKYPFTDALVRSLPSGPLGVHMDRTLVAMQMRFDLLARHLDGCRRLHGEDTARSLDRFM